MRRKPFRKQAASVTLFPFLAVLICTMGSLILLLVILVQQARVEADTIKAEQSHELEQQQTATEKELQLERDVAEWRTGVLLEARQENVETLATRRLELSHLDDHIRELQDRWQQLTTQVEELERLGQNRQLDNAATEVELASLRAAIETAEQELAAAKQRATDRPRSFAIVPSPRKNGTLRRPIYIECTSTGVVLQPEGLVLGPRDFVQPLGPGNALDSALRATREYLARHGGVSEHGEPYPLLLVRPDGAVAYAAAREALRSWDDEFGYELLDAEMQLAYPPDDPALAEQVRRAVDLARKRQEALAASAPTRYRQLLQPGSTSRGGGNLQSSEQRGRFAVGPMRGTGGSRGASDELRANPSAAPTQDQVTSGTGSTAAGESAKNQRLGADQPRGAPTEFDPQAANNSKPGAQSAFGGGNGGPLESMANQRGQNWALGGGSGQRSNAYTRPIRVACSPNQLLVFPEPRTTQRLSVLALRDSMRPHIDELVEIVKTRVSQWGDAPVRGYWRPVLSVEVYAGGERRFEELRTLLSGSGLDIERR